MSEIPPQLKPHVFTSENQPANRGRKKSVLNHLSELTGEAYKLELSQGDKYRIVECILEKSEEELKEIEADATKPMFLRYLAKAMQDGFAVGKLEILETIFDRVYGRPKQDTKVHHTGEMDFTVNFDKLNAHLAETGSED